MEKKDSIFSGLTPAPAPAPVPRPAAQDPEVSALKHKIEALEKKIAEAVKAAVPAPPPPAAAAPPESGEQFLLARLGELDRRLEEFARSALVSSAQMKNIEESKISARREIEDLLKVVREQQKYSEMDRQIHEQLEKSWRRVEELEKKLMDFYGTMLAGQQKKEEIDGLLSRDLGGKIEALAAGLELRARAVEKKVLEQDALLAAAPDLKSEIRTELARTREETLSLAREQAAAAPDLKSEIRNELARTREETLSLAREQAASFRAVIEEQLKHRFELLWNSLTAELERSRGAAAGDMELLKKEFAGHLAGFQVILEGFQNAARESLAAAGEAAGSLTRNTAETAAVFKACFEKLGEALGRDGGKFLSELEERNKRQFEALNTKYADALLSADALNFVGASAGASLKHLAGLEETLSALLRQADASRLDSALGVSGLLARKVFSDMEALLARLRQEAAALERIKKEAEDRANGVSRGKLTHDL
ncbi:MAG: hypothetical protein HY550_10550 [Elusimicrobia bacterium]|nr:hypothetical protein [Elusimicrobiota bacterium]